MEYWSNGVLGERTTCQDQNFRKLEIEFQSKKILDNFFITPSPHYSNYIFPNHAQWKPRKLDGFKDVFDSLEEGGANSTWSGYQS